MGITVSIFRPDDRTDNVASPVERGNASALTDAERSLRSWAEYHPTVARHASVHVQAPHIDLQGPMLDSYEESPSLSLSGPWSAVLEPGTRFTVSGELPEGADTSRRTSWLGQRGDAARQRTSAVVVPELTTISNTPCGKLNDGFKQVQFLDLLEASCSVSEQTPTTAASAANKRSCELHPLDTCITHEEALLSFLLHLIWTPSDTNANHDPLANEAVWSALDARWSTTGVSALTRREVWQLCLAVLCASAYAPCIHMACGDADASSPCEVGVQPPASSTTSSTRGYASRRLGASVMDTVTRASAAAAAAAATTTTATEGPPRIQRHCASAPRPEPEDAEYLSTRCCALCSWLQKRFILRMRRDMALIRLCLWSLCAEYQDKDQQMPQRMSVWSASLPLHIGRDSLRLVDDILRSLIPNSSDKPFPVLVGERQHGASLHELKRGGRQHAPNATTLSTLPAPKPCRALDSTPKQPLAAATDAPELPACVDASAAASVAAPVANELPLPEQRSQSSDEALWHRWQQRRTGCLESLSYDPFQHDLFADGSISVPFETLFDIDALLESLAALVARHTGPALPTDLVSGDLNASGGCSLRTHTARQRQTQETQQLDTQALERKTNIQGSLQECPTNAAAVPNKFSRSISCIHGCSSSRTTCLEARSPTPPPPPPPPPLPPRDEDMQRSRSSLQTDTSLDGRRLFINGGFRHATGAGTFSSCSSSGSLQSPNASFTASGSERTNRSTLARESALSLQDFINNERRCRLRASSFTDHKRYRQDAGSASLGGTVRRQQSPRGDRSSPSTGIEAGESARTLCDGSTGVAPLARYPDEGEDPLTTDLDLMERYVEALEEVLESLEASASSVSATGRAASTSVLPYRRSVRYPRCASYPSFGRNPRAHYHQHHDHHHHHHDHDRGYDEYDGNEQLQCWALHAIQMPSKPQPGRRFTLLHQRQQALSRAGARHPLLSELLQVLSGSSTGNQGICANPKDGNLLQREASAAAGAAATTASPTGGRVLDAASPERSVSRPQRRASLRASLWLASSATTALQSYWMSLASSAGMDAERFHQNDGSRSRHSRPDAGTQSSVSEGGFWTRRSGVIPERYPSHRIQSVCAAGAPEIVLVNAHAYRCVPGQTTRSPVACRGYTLLYRWRGTDPLPCMFAADADLHPSASLSRDGERLMPAAAEPLVSSLEREPGMSPTSLGERFATYSPCTASDERQLQSVPAGMLDASPLLQRYGDVVGASASSVCALPAGHVPERRPSSTEATDERFETPRRTSSPSSAGFSSPVTPAVDVHTYRGRIDHAAFIAADSASVRLSVDAAASIERCSDANSPPAELASEAFPRRHAMDALLSTATHQPDAHNSGFAKRTLHAATSALHQLLGAASPLSERARNDAEQDAVAGNSCRGRQCMSGPRSMRTGSGEDAGVARAGQQQAQCALLRLDNSASPNDGPKAGIWQDPLPRNSTWVRVQRLVSSPASGAADSGSEAFCEALLAVNASSHPRVRELVRRTLPPDIGDSVTILGFGAVPASLQTLCAQCFVQYTVDGQHADSHLDRYPQCQSMDAADAVNTFTASSWTAEAHLRQQARALVRLGVDASGMPASLLDGVQRAAAAPAAAAAWDSLPEPLLALCWEAAVASGIATPALLRFYAQRVAPQVTLTAADSGLWPNIGPGLQIRPAPVSLGHRFRVAAPYRTRIRDTWLLALAPAAAGAATLETLDLSGCSHITDRGLIGLAPHLRQLKECILDGCLGIWGPGVRALLRLCSKLERLSLAGCRSLTDEAFQGLASGVARGPCQRTSAGRFALKHLDLSSCIHLTDEGLGALVAALSTPEAKAGDSEDTAMESVATTEASAGLVAPLTTEALLYSSSSNSSSSSSSNSSSNSSSSGTLETLSVAHCFRLGDRSLRPLLRQHRQSLRVVDLSYTRITGAVLPELGALPQLQSLSLCGCGETLSVESDAATRFGEELALPGKQLVHLDLGKCARLVTDGFLAALAGLASGRRTHHQYNRQQYQQNPAAVERLVHATHGVYSSRDALRSLSVHGCRLTDRSLSHYVRLFQGLERLDLSQCRLITDAGLEHLQSLTSLRELDLADTNVTSAVGASLLARLRQLRRLDLSYTAVQSNITKSLSTLEQLEWLGLDARLISDDALQVEENEASPEPVSSRDVAAPALSSATVAVHLHRRIGLPRHLRHLDLFGAHITDRGMSYLVQACPYLESLEVCSGALTDAALRLIAQHLPYLRALNISQNMRISDAGLREYARLAQVQQDLGQPHLLETLNLAFTAVTWRGLAVLLPTLPYLRLLCVRGCNKDLFSAVSVQSLERMRPGLVILGAETDQPGS